MENKKKIYNCSQSLAFAALGRAKEKSVRIYSRYQYTYIHILYAGIIEWLQNSHRETFCQNDTQVNFT